MVQRDGWQARAVPHALHGPDLVDAVAAAAGLAARARAGRSGRGPTTPSVERWRRYSTQWVGRALRPMGWDRMLDTLAPWLRGMVCGLDGPMLPLQLGDEQASFLHAGPRDAVGEWPVLTLDVRDQAVSLAAPGFDVWLALQHDVFDDVPRTYAPRMRWHVRHGLGGDAILRLREGGPRKMTKDTAGARRRAGLSDETRTAIAALAKRRKGDVLLAALELAQELEGNLDDATAKAVAKELGRFPDEGLALADLLRIAPGTVRKKNRLKR